MDTGLRLVLLRMAVGALIVATSSCTLKAANPDVNFAPPQKYTTFIVGEISTEDKTLEAILLRFKSQLVRLLIEKGAFETVRETTPSEPNGPAITLSGAIAEFREGVSALLRCGALMAIGGLCKKARGLFEIKDSKGKTLAIFEERVETGGYLDGLRLQIGSLLGAGWMVAPILAGAGEVLADPVLHPRENLMDRLAESVAETLLKWSRGKKIDR